VILGARQRSGDFGEQLKRLLQRENWHPGGALGLLLVQDIAVAHGGSLTIESRTERDDPFTGVAFTIPARLG